MNRMKDAAFYLGLGLLFTHELDSMPNHEWRVLPVLSSLPDETGATVFLLAHVPIFAIVIAFIASLDERIRLRARNIFCGFLVLHAGLHYAFSGSEAYEFQSWSSVGLIFGAGVCGLLYFLAAYFDRDKNLHAS